MSTSINSYKKETASHPSDIYPEIVVESSDKGQIPIAGTGGVAVTQIVDGKAKSFRYGVGYAVERGMAHGGPNGVGFVGKGGTASAGDGGVAVAHNYDDAYVGMYGIAYSQNPGPVKGFVQGAKGALLVIGWVENEQSHQKSIQVGEQLSCGSVVEENQWYTLNSSNNHEWIKDGNKPQPAPW